MQANSRQPVLSPTYSDKLRGRFVFLSASFPSPARGPEYYETARPFEITDATVAAARAVLGARGRLVFGAHPTIAPLILSVGRGFLEDFAEKERPLVYVYQSELFKMSVPEETEQLQAEGIGKIHWVPAVDNDREKSLLRMRVEMISDTEPIAAVFIGGMEGVYRAGAEARPWDPEAWQWAKKKGENAIQQFLKPWIRESEFSLFRAIRKHCPIYPIGPPGGAAYVLLKNLKAKKEYINWEFKAVELDDLLSPPAYGFLMERIVLDMTK